MPLMELWNALNAVSQGKTIDNGKSGYNAWNRQLEA